ncbi:hypothetical protein B0H16DRAFT_1418844 [Mycena metata]|uniref:Ubiquitin-like protease family profile domain-containing protein n=1 Tax=Mycena metata TaxID=1033252 RepID=A0AAD7IY98_9AGAR|nr:hypothetical protein B0H16DRAFT_1418844 [Mycena metata]
MSGLPDVLKIPDGPEKLSIPAGDLPVSALIKLELPPQRTSSIFTHPTDYLSELAPTITTFNVTEIVVPPSHVVKALGRAILLDPELQSIVLVHSPAQGGKDIRYPLWFATIWSLMERVREARTLWRPAVQQVTEMIKKSTTSESAAQHARAAIEALDMLPWDGSVKGFRTGGTVDDLARWFTKDWLRSDHEDQMLEILASDLGLTDSSTLSIRNSFFVNSLAQAYDAPEAYRAGEKHQWLRKIGQALATKDRTRLGTITNKNENHWVALAIDCEKESVGYGDGFGDDPSRLLRKHVDWWIREHLGTTFTWGDLPVAKQNDPYSCGILGYFDLAHWCDSKRFPLPKCTAASMADERLKMFLRIVERHKAEGFVSEARDYEFTFAHPHEIAGDQDKGSNVEAVPTGSEYTNSEQSTPSAPPSPSPRKTLPLKPPAPLQPPPPSSPSSVHSHSSEDKFPFHVPVEDERPITPTGPKRTHSE